MHHRGDDDLVRQKAEVDAVRESSDDGPACFAVDSGEGQRIGRDALYCLIYRVGELAAESGVAGPRTTDEPTGLLRRPAAERQAGGSLPAAQLTADVFPGNRRLGVREMLGPTPIEFGRLIGAELQFRFSLLV